MPVCVLVYILFSQNADHPLWQFGTQPVMLMLSHGQWDSLDPKWNVDGVCARACV